MNKRYVGDGNVKLIAGGGRIYTDVAARFVRSERSLDDIVASPYSQELVKRILSSGHKAALEFDFFIFGVEGFSRVAEVQLVRKRMASYMIKSGRLNKGRKMFDTSPPSVGATQHAIRVKTEGKRSFDAVIPKSIERLRAKFMVPIESLSLPNGTCLSKYLPASQSQIMCALDSDLILAMIEQWYNEGIDQDIPEEDLRYLKPQATEFKAIIGMNAHALTDWFAIRCCRNAQAEIRDLATKMLRICQEVARDLFDGAGPSCRQLGYCPENGMQNKTCRGKVITKDEAMRILRHARR